jgi:hypothetical protein
MGVNFLGTLEAALSVRFSPILGKIGENLMDSHQSLLAMSTTLISRREKYGFAPRCSGY